MNYTVNDAEPDEKTRYWSTYADMQMYYIMDGRDDRRAPGYGRDCDHR